MTVNDEFDEDTGKLIDNIYKEKTTFTFLKN